MPHVDLHSLIETNERPLVVIDREYHIIAANSAYCRLYGMAREEVLRRRCHEVSHHSPRPCHEHGELCPHLALFSTGEATEVLHTH